MAKKIGVSLISVQRWESNRYSPLFDDLQRILKILDADLHDIMDPAERKKCQTIKSTQRIVRIADNSLLFAGIKKGDEIIFDTLKNSFASIDGENFFAIKIKIEVWPKSSLKILGKAIKLIRDF